MELKIQKRLAAGLLHSSRKRVRFEQSRLDDIKEAITKTDIRGLIAEGAISAKPVKGVARAKANLIRKQKRKGLRKGFGKRKGKSTARNPPKTLWMRKVRHQRRFLKLLKQKGLITNQVFKMLYYKVKGGFFRSRKHIKLYLDENKLIKKQDAK